MVTGLKSILLEVRFLTLLNRCESRVPLCLFLMLTGAVPGVSLLSDDVSVDKFPDL